METSSVGNSACGGKTGRLLLITMIILLGTVSVLLLIFDTIHVRVILADMANEITNLRYDSVKQSLDISNLLPKKETSIYLSVYGDTRDTAAPSCHHIKRERPTAASGVYWLKLKSNPKAPFQVYCDQVTDGGGWTLVYSYRFTNYNSFTSSSNAVSPRPNWQVNGSGNIVPISVKPPLQEYGSGAMDFKKWKEIGAEILIKSNINHWIACKPNRGSLIQWRAGSLICRNIKNMLSTCRGIFPNKLQILRHGPSFSRSSLFYYFDGSTSAHWPVHDPCGANGAQQKKGVKNPGGNLFIR